MHILSTTFTRHKAENIDTLVDILETTRNEVLKGQARAGLRALETSQNLGRSEFDRATANFDYWRTRRELNKKVHELPA